MLKNETNSFDGGKTVIPLCEGTFTIDKSKLFVPFDGTSGNLQSIPTGSVLVEIQPFLIITSKDVLVLDTGLGLRDSVTGEMQIHVNLRKAGVQPEQVTKVLLSHLHTDHAGGISLHTDRTKLAFPNAVYYVQRREFAYALAENDPAYAPEELQVLKSSPQVYFLDSNKGVIDDYIFYEYTGAHSPHHQVFWIKDGGRTIFFGGDDVLQLQQMKVRYKTKYDFEPDKCMNLRRQWWEQCNTEGWTLLFYHDIGTPVHD